MHYTMHVAIACPPHYFRDGSKAHGIIDQLRVCKLTPENGTRVSLNNINIPIIITIHVTLESGSMGGTSLLLQ
jgi:hypothetical protein